MMHLSVALAIYNEEQNLASCLQAVADWADEIVIVDGGSTDRSIEIAKSFKAKVIRTTNPPIFHINKQKAVDACQGAWVLQLDADELVTAPLKNEIDTVTHSDKTQDGYFIPRKNYFLGHWMRKGGQYPDYVIRLFRRGKGTFPARSVHEQIVIEGSVGTLTNPLEHQSHKSIAEYWRKSTSYVKLYAAEMKRDNVTKSWWNWISYGFMKPMVTFFMLFVRHKGFIDGVYGFLFALFSAWHHSKAYTYYVFHSSYDQDSR